MIILSFQLALTESNSLYTWGMSPQCLRFQAQARKKSKLAQNQICPSTSSSELEAAKTPTEDCLQSCSPNEFSDSSGNLDKTLVDHHLSPSLVDKRNVIGKISQVAYCGAHNYRGSTIPITSHECKIVFICRYHVGATILLWLQILVAFTRGADLWTVNSERVLNVKFEFLPK